MKQHWDERYASEEYIYGTEPNRWFAGHLRILKAGRLLLPAEGEGRNAAFAAAMGWEVHAFDQSREGQRKALKLAAQKGVNIRYTIDSLEEMADVEGQFDAIALIFVHIHEEHRAAVHRRLASMLRPRGMLILEAFSRKQLNYTTGGPRSEAMLYTAAMLKGDFSGLELSFCEEARIHLDEGPLHLGDAEVVRLLAIKTE
ncbi:class I SAM-dependent methyltransferase [Lentimicrobium sp.]|uniref:class I SAM-dependent methyltransferase n=1 Tax=Lentimicrobium sp. TaxID=2034841 RepID=UPI002D0FA27D|nr:class I SAM-dependent methyltransferase [Lentimicrobium sp.]HPR27065.1 class I SAM-dependent methyltransferase [Lentimicrobium sp.]